MYITYVTSNNSTELVAAPSSKQNGRWQLVGRSLSRRWWPLWCRSRSIWRAASVALTWELIKPQFGHWILTTYGTRLTNSQTNQENIEKKKRETEREQNVKTDAIKCTTGIYILHVHCRTILNAADYVEAWGEVSALLETLGKLVMLNYFVPGFVDLIVPKYNQLI